MTTKHNVTYPRRRGGRQVLPRMCLVLAICFVWAMCTGLPDFGLAAFTEFFLQSFGFGVPDQALQAVFFDIRLPRAVLAIMAGAGLALAGTGTQAVLNNPLVEPSILGISAGASFGAATVILYGGALYAAMGLPLLMSGAFSAAMAAAGITYALSSIHSDSKETVILAGIAVSYIFAAGTVFLQYLAPYQDLRAIVFWTVGSLWSANWQAVAVLGPLLATAFALLLASSASLNALALGEESASGVGVRVKNLRLRVLLICTLLSASIVSFTGAIGFVGLIAPHLARTFIGRDNRLLIPAAMLTGAVLLLAADTLARLLLWPQEIPVGVMTSMLGGPFFLYRLLRRKKDLWS